MVAPMARRSPFSLNRNGKEYNEDRKQPTSEVINGANRRSAHNDPLDHDEADNKTRWSPDGGNSEIAFTASSRTRSSKDILAARLGGVPSVQRPANGLDLIPRQYEMVGMTGSRSF